MPKLSIFQVDAFADALFAGNPAAVVPLDAFLEDATMQAIAAENNLAETAFVVTREDGYDLRWFTPKVEVDLCGHATLATAHVLARHLGAADVLKFSTRSGELLVTRSADGMLSLDFPAQPLSPEPEPAGLAEALGATPLATFAGERRLAVFERAQDILALKPDFKALAALSAAEGGLSVVVVTAPYAGPEPWDFVSRMFAPAKGIDEDPVTGAAHCSLVPYWADRLGKTDLIARQASQRGGTLWCSLAGDRVILRGRCVDYLKGEITV